MNLEKILQQKTALLEFDNTKRQMEKELYSNLKNLYNFIDTETNFFDELSYLYFDYDKGHIFYTFREFMNTQLGSEWNYIKPSESIFFTIDSDKFVGNYFREGNIKYLFLSLEDKKTLMLSIHDEHCYDGEMNRGKLEVIFNFPLESIDTKEKLLSELDKFKSEYNNKVKADFDKINQEKEKEKLIKKEKERQEKLKQLEKLKKELGLN